MIERDFLMRQISLLVQSLAKVLFHKKAYEYPQAKKEIDAAYKSLLGVTSDFIRQFSDVQLLEFFGKDVETLGVKYYILGALLKDEAEIHQSENREHDSLAYFEKSLSLLLSAFNDLGTPIEPEHTAKIESVVGQLRSKEMPQHIKAKLFLYYESIGKYDKAEDVLFELVESDSQFVQPGIAFYERLLKISNDELTKGGLPCIEVLDGLNHLQKEKSVK